MRIRTTFVVLIAGLGLVGFSPTSRAEDGAAVFKEQCAKCHGETGESDTPTAKTLKVPNLKGASKVAAMSTEDIVAALKANAKHKGVLAKLTDAQIGAAGGFVKQLAGNK